MSATAVRDEGASLSLHRATVASDLALKLLINQGVLVLRGLSLSVLHKNLLQAVRTCIQFKSNSQRAALQQNGYGSVDFADPCQFSLLKNSFPICRSEFGMLVHMKGVAVGCPLLVSFMHGDQTNSFPDSGRTRYPLARDKWGPQRGGGDNPWRLRRLVAPGLLYREG